MYSHFLHKCSYFYIRFSVELFGSRLLEWSTCSTPVAHLTVSQALSILQLPQFRSYAEGQGGLGAYSSTRPTLCIVDAHVEFSHTEDCLLAFDLSHGSSHNNLRHIEIVYRASRTHYFFWFWCSSEQICSLLYYSITTTRARRHQFRKKPNECCPIGICHGNVRLSRS